MPMRNFDSNYLYFASDKAIRFFVDLFAPSFYSEAQLEDLVGNFRLKLLRSDSYDPAKGSFGGWIYQSAKRFVLTDLKKESERRSHIVSFDSFQDVSSDDYEGYAEYPDHLSAVGFGSERPDEILIAKERRENFYGSLSARNRRICELKEQGFSSEEIAEMLDTTVQAVYMAVFHSKKAA